MAGYQELIKNFSKLRDYMRDFFVYGFKTREDYRRKSGRTYDNERRHIENFLGKYIRWEYNKKGKRVFLSFSTLRFTQNPFYQAYLAKSFTDNDIILHFCLLDMLQTGPKNGVETITDQLSTDYSQCFDEQTVRAKLAEYVKIGILQKNKEGRSYQYKLSEETLFDLFSKEVFLNPAIAFFSEMAPLGVIGNYLQQENSLINKEFMFKHHFIATVLDDEVLLTVLQAMHEHRFLHFTNFSERAGGEKSFLGIPMKILVSLQNGRRYILIKYSNKLACFRLDYIKKAKVGEKIKEWEKHQIWTENRLQNAWGIAHTWRNCKENISLVLHIDEKNEEYVLQRLQRERRTGVVNKLTTNTFCYTATVSDAGELLTWVKSFTGRIKSFTCSNQEVQGRFERDMQRMFKLYGGVK